jgi:hypothetical protein
MGNVLLFFFNFPEKTSVFPAPKSGLVQEALLYIVIKLPYMKIFNQYEN